MSASQAASNVEKERTRTLAGLCDKCCGVAPPITQMVTGGCEARAKLRALIEQPPEVPPIRREAAADDDQRRN